MANYDITQEYVLTRGVAEILPDKNGLSEKMENGKITLYQGFDPTAPSLHIGHFIGIRKLAQFQKLGHKVIFLIGDFTAMIGDPTDKKAARTMLTRKEVLSNLESYKEQVSRVLSFDGENAAEIKFNSKWLSSLTLEEILSLASNFTVQQMLERDFFQERVKAGKPIYLHEFLYPLMVSDDALEMGVDLEIGGTDQMFNMMIGRNLIKEKKGIDKYVLTLKLLADPNGKKMGKTEGNAINLSDPSNEIYGKIMSLPDSFLERGVELLTDFPMDILQQNPMEVKKKVAFETVKQLRGGTEASQAQKYFEEAFQSDAIPENVSTFEIESDTQIVDVLAMLPRVGSKSQAKRLITEGAIDINEDTVKELNTTLNTGDIIKIGKKHFIKVTTRE